MLFIVSTNHVYIHLTNGPCYTNLVYLKETCILYAVDM